jgi:predicted nucleic acid-binding protein
VGVALLDSSALIGFLDVDDALHASAVATIEEALRGGSRLAISAVTWAETLNGAYQGHHDDQIVRGFVSDLGVSILPVDADVAEQAAFLQARYARAGTRRETPRLRTPDALILGTAIRFEDIDAVVCGDSQWINVLDGSVEIKLLREWGT